MMNVDKSKFDDREFKEYYNFDFQKFLLYDSRVKTFGNEPADKVFARELKKENRNLAIESRRLSLDIGADAQNLMNLKLNSLNCISDDFDIYDKLNIINNFENIDKRLVK